MVIFNNGINRCQPEAAVFVLSGEVGIKYFIQIIFTDADSLVGTVIFMYGLLLVIGQDEEN